MLGDSSCRLDESPLQRTERENSEIVAQTKQREMANRLKFRETITKAEQYIRKHCTTIYIRRCTLTHTEKENTMKRSLWTVHTLHTKKCTICVIWKCFIFALRIKKNFFFYPGRRNPKAIRRWNLEISRQEFQECHDWAKAPGLTWLGKSSRSDTTGWKLYAAGN